MKPQDVRVVLQAAIVAACNSSPALFAIPEDHIAWDNVRYSPTPGEIWARVVVQHDLDNPKSISLGDPSAKRYTYGGMLLAQIFQPAKDNGLRTADARAWELAELLQSKRFGSGNELLTQGAAVREAGNLEPEWFQYNVTIPFTYEHIA